MAKCYGGNVKSLDVASWQSVPPIGAETSCRLIEIECCGTDNSAEVEFNVAEPAVPAGFVVLDTAALSECACDRALRRHEQLIDMTLEEKPSDTILRGINSRMWVHLAVREVAELRRTTATVRTAAD
jgi:hypothetical protein